MGGWFQAFSNIAGGLGQGLDRYQALRQLDEKNRWQAVMNQEKLTQDAQDSQLKDLQSKQLMAALLDRSRSDLLDSLTPGQSLDAGTAQQVKDLGRGFLIDNSGTHFTPPTMISPVSPLPADLKEYALSQQAPPQQLTTAGSPPLTTNTPAYQLNAPDVRNNMYLGTPKQKADQESEQLKRTQVLAPLLQQQSLMDRIQSGHFDPTHNVTDAILLNVGTGGKVNVADISSKPDPIPGGELGYLMSLPTDQRQTALGVARTIHPPPGSTASGLSPQALNWMAAYTNAGGGVPPLGMSAAGRTQFYNYMGTQGAPGSAPVLAKANLTSDAASLKNITQTSDMLEGFKKGATKNLDLFEKTVGPLVDTGSPWLNAPVRDLEKNAIGNEDVSNMLSARNVALREVARVTHNPRLTSILSVDSVKAVMDLVPASATLGQIYGVLGILRKDMDNIDNSLQEQRTIIQNRMANGYGDVTTPTATSPAGATPGSTVTNWVFDANGKLVQQK